MEEVVNGGFDLEEVERRKKKEEREKKEKSEGKREVWPVTLGRWGPYILSPFWLDIK